MKRFGTLTLSIQVVILLSIAMSAYIFNHTGILATLALPMAFTLSHVFNTPVITVGNGRISIYTLNIFRKSISVNIAEINKIVIEDGYTVRYTFDMNNGEMYSILATTFMVDMQPVYSCLTSAGTRLEKDGFPILA